MPRTLIYILQSCCKGGFHPTVDTGNGHTIMHNFATKKYPIPSTMNADGSFYDLGRHSKSSSKESQSRSFVMVVDINTVDDVFVVVIAMLRAFGRMKEFAAD